MDMRGDGRGTHHLHGAEHRDRIPLLDFAALVNAHLDHDAGHGRADLAGVGEVGLETLLVLDGGLLVVDRHLSHLAVHLVEDFTLARLLRERADGQQLQDQHLAPLELDRELLADLWLAQEVSRRQHAEIAVLDHELAVVLEHLRVHGVAGHVAVADLAEAIAQLPLDLVEVHGLQRQTGSPVELASSAQRLRPERLREAAVRLAHEPLEEFEHRAGEVELCRLFQNVVVAEFVRHHELCQVADDLGCRRDLDDVAEQLVGLLVRFLCLGPALAEPQLGGLEDEVRQLATRDLVLVHLGVGPGEARLEGRVEQAQLGPVRVERSDLLAVQTGVVRPALERGEDGADAGLRRHAGHAVGCRVDGVGAGHGAGHHRGHAGAGRVVRVHVDGEVWVLLADGTDELRRRRRFQDAGHVLDAQHVGSHLDDPVDETHVVGQVVFLVRVEHIAAVADRRFHDAASLLDGLDAHLELVHIVESVKDAKDVDAVLLGVLAEVVDGIVGQPRSGSVSPSCSIDARAKGLCVAMPKYSRGVSDAIGAPEQHLEGNVRDQPPQLPQPLPRILVQESHGDVEGGASPALEAVGIAVGIAGVLGNVHQVHGSDPGRKQRLMCVTPRRVHQEAPVVLSDSLGKRCCALLDDDVPPALLAGPDYVDLVPLTVRQHGHDDICLQPWLSDLSLDAASVDSDVSEVAEQFLGAVLAAKHREEFGPVESQSACTNSHVHSYMCVHIPTRERERALTCRR